MASTDPIIGKKLGDYLIESILGTGGMARVYRGYDEKLDRYAAIKVIEPQLVASTEEEEYRERFLREARSIARLSHARIVGVYQFGQVENLYYIAMEYIEGRNLREIMKGYLKDDQRMPPAEVLSNLRDIGDALDYAHKNNIIHRDVKPSNIIVNKEGQAILTDFGLALNALEGTIGNTFGSVHYIAPEQAISSAQAVAQSDQYSLAIIAYELLTGRVPFDDASAMSVALKHISDPPPPPRDLNPDIPVEAEQILVKALDKDLNKRYPSCAEFVQALQIAYMPHDLEERPTKNMRTQPTPLPIAPVKIATGEIPAVKSDTAGTPQLGTLTGIGTQSQPSLPTVPPPTGGNIRLGWVVAAVLALILVIGAALVLPGVLNPNNPDATATARVVIAQAAQVALDNTATAQAIINQAIDATGNARETGTAIIEMTNSAFEITATWSQGVQLTAAALDIRLTAQAERPTATATPTATDLPTNTATTAPTHTATDAPTATLTALPPTIAPSATATPRPRMTATPNSNATVRTTIAPSATNTLRPTVTNTRTSAPTATFTATTAPSPTPSPTITNIPTNTPTATIAATATPGLTMLDENDDQIVLIYDGRSLVLYNRDLTRNVQFTNLDFYLYEPNEQGDLVETQKFRAISWTFDTNGLPPERCVQVWDSSLGILAPDAPPANLCRVRLYYSTVPTPFWASEAYNRGSYFEVRFGPRDILATCPVSEPETFRQLRCTVKRPPVQ